MNHDLPLVLITAVSPHERRTMASSLTKTGFSTVVVDDAEEAAKEFANGTPRVLVIDSGLLEAPQDSQWRGFRECHPGLGAVVRCLIPRANGSLQMDSRTVLVHPDDDEGMRHAVRVLVALPS